jgi:hypothetical protein
MPACGYSAPRHAGKHPRMTNVSDPHGFFARCSQRSPSWPSPPSFSRVSLVRHLPRSPRKKPFLVSAWRMATLCRSDISSTGIAPDPITPRNRR